MYPASGTIHANADSLGVNRVPPRARQRLAGLVLIGVVGALLILLASRRAWQRLDGLQTGFGTLRTESFYLGVHLQGGIRRLNDILLRGRLKVEVADEVLFRKEAAELQDWLGQNRSKATTPLEHQFFEEMGVAYEQYINDSQMLLVILSNQSSNAPVDFPRHYEQVQAQSRHLLELCTAFIAAQHTAFDRFMEESHNTLRGLGHWLQFSVGALLMLAFTVLLLIYRGAIAPLRNQLTESQAIILRQEKLASLGVLAAGVAHEIRNPLTAIKFRLFSLRQSLLSASGENEDAVVIGNEINRLERIVKDFLEFARPSEPEFVATPAARLLTEVCDLLKPQMDKLGIVIEVQPDGSEWVRVDTAQIKQVLINLVQNAADSIGRNGRIKLGTRAGRAPGRRGDRWVALEVADTGKGIPPETQKRLFDPFFTTKEGGTGLGLPIAARIVEKHGGELHYQTQLNRGTTFSVVLPRAYQDEIANPVD